MKAGVRGVPCHRDVVPLDGQAPSQEKGVAARNGSAGQAPSHTRHGQASSGNLYFASESATGGGTSQQTVVTEGLCGKMVKFGLKQAVSLVMSCC